MAPLLSILSTVEAGAEKYGPRPALKIPCSQPGSSEIQWEDVTFTRLSADVDTRAHYWATHGWAPHSVIGLWLKGTSYSDLITILGISRAGFVPQLVSVKLPNPDVVFELLHQSSAAALVVDSSFESLATSRSCPFPVYKTSDIVDDPDAANNTALPEPNTDPEQVVMIYHTSGSTSGMPKLVPLTAKFMDDAISKSQQSINSPEPPVGTISGSFCHAASIHIFVRYLTCGGSVVLPSSIPVSVPEIRQMLLRCGLNSLSLFGSTVSQVLKAAQGDPALLAQLQDLDRVSFGGMGVEDPLSDWALENGVALVDAFGCTEVGIMLVAQEKSKNGQGFLLRPFRGSQYEFCAVEGHGEGQKLVELVVPPEAVDCPHGSLRDPRDGKFHTGDLFEEVEPGGFVSRGRNDDWIKMEQGLRCDTAYIEGKALELCGKDLVGSVVVVGSNRASPVLVVEPKVEVEGADAQKAFKEEVLRRIIPFTAVGYLHERVSDIEHILVASPGSLPRTASKGNIRRKAVEEVYKERLDEIFS